MNLSTELLLDAALSQFIGIVALNLILFAGGLETDSGKIIAELGLPLEFLIVLADKETFAQVEAGAKSPAPEIRE